MLFIDWISTPTHRNFNRSFFSALALNKAKCIVFSDKLVIPEVECTLLEQKKNRVRQAIEIFRLIWNNRSEDIFLLTYDPLFLPIASLLHKRLVVFEHNTTPEEGWSKHYLWQKLFFERVHRMAQFPGQYDRLLRIGSGTTYIGSPILPTQDQEGLRRSSSRPFLFLAPSYRATMSELGRFSKFFRGATILVKKVLISSPIQLIAQEYTIEPLERIEFKHCGRQADAVIITIQSRLRGTGWFNDSISNCTPIIITNRSARILFEETFPGYPFIDLESIKDVSNFEKLMTDLGQLDSSLYIQHHNALLRARFHKMCAAIGIECVTS